MGKQFNILATNVDLQCLDEKLRATGDVEILSDVASSDLSRLNPLDQLQIPVEFAGKSSLICYLAAVRLPSRISIKSESPVKTHVDIGQSHLIQFWRPFYDGRIVRPGRLYYEDRILANKEFVQKDPAFCDWAKGVMALVRKTLRRDSVHDSYVGADAAGAIEDGHLKVGSILR
jgi:hypothetical protein